MKTKVRLNEGMQFVGDGESGHSILFDSKEDVGGKDSAVRPVETLVITAGACSGMDVVSLLRKMKQKFSDFEVLLEADRAEEHPKVLERLQLTYRVWGEVEEEKFKKAINLSLDKYCGVVNTLKPDVKVSHECRINPEE